MLKVLEIALAEVGYLEKASNNDLDSKTGNAGSANFTKYARDIDRIAGFYNGKKNGFAWCDVFVDWCFVEAYGAETAKKMLFQPDYSAGAGCPQSASYFKQAGRFSQIPTIGDQIFFTYGGTVGHTGLVYAVDDTYVYTVEGNTSGASGVIPNGGGVCKKRYNRTYSSIYGYGRPDYSLIGQNTIEDDDQVKLYELSKGSKGSEVESLQCLLIHKHKISCGIWGMDGDFGSWTEKAVKTFQQKRGLSVDGVCGTDTWKALLK